MESKKISAVLLMVTLVPSSYGAWPEIPLMVETKGGILVHGSNLGGGCNCEVSTPFVTGRCSGLWPSGYSNL